MGMNRRRRIGILGGTFNPIHIGHLAIAQVVQEKCDLDKVIFVPSFLPPHKKIPDLASAQDRFAMVQLSIKDNPRFAVSDFEIKREGKSYSIDTVRYFQETLPAGTKLFFIIGEDSAAELETWREITALLKAATFIVVNRPGHSQQSTKMKHLTVTMPGIDVSSSYIRRQVKLGESINYLVPRGVFRYIEKHHLYGSH